MLAGWAMDSRRRLRLWQIDHLLGEITPAEIPPDALDRFVYGRLNAEYEPIHHLCALFLRGASVSEHAGGTQFRTFLLDMNQLFEHFVTEALRLRAPRGLDLSGQYATHLDRDRRVAIRPDLLVSRHGRPTLVADCKYKRVREDTVHHHDVYQTLAYCTALGLDRGMLLYPKHEAPDLAAIAIRNRDIVIRQVALDLGGAPSDLTAACDALADTVFGWAAP